MKALAVGSRLNEAVGSRLNKIISHHTSFIPYPLSFSFFPSRSLAQDFFQALLQFAFEAAIGGAVVFAVYAEVVLRGDGIGRVVGVLIILAVT